MIFSNKCKMLTFRIERNISPAEVDNFLRRTAKQWDAKKVTVFSIRTFSIKEPSPIRRENEIGENRSRFGDDFDWISTLNMAEPKTLPVAVDLRKGIEL